MKRHSKYLLLILIPLVLIVISVFVFSRQGKKNDEVKRTKYGVSGYIPTNFPNSSVSDLRNYWNDVNKYSDIYGIHVNWNELDTALNLSKNVKGDVYVLFGFQTPSDWKETDKVIQNIEAVLKQRSNVKYIGVGNEINDINRKYSKDFSIFKRELNKISGYMKSNYPDVEFFTTFQYDSLLGKAKLMNVNSKTEVSMVKEFEDSVDFIGYTVYPFLEYKDVNSIPANYFTDLTKLSSRPYAITETSWPTQDLKNSKFVFSEAMQEEYYKKIFELPVSESFLFLNTVFLNDITNWEKADNSKYSLFDSVGIRYNDGREKSAFKVWSESVD